MKIHHALENLQIGGAETLVVALSRLQQKDGHEVVVHGIFGGGPLEAALRESNIPVVIHPPAHKLLLMAKLWPHFRRTRPDVVHCHNVSPTIVTAPGARAAGVRSVVSTRHGSSSHTAIREKKFWWASKFFDRAVAVSEAAHREFLKDVWTKPEKLITIHNGSPEPSTTPGRDADASKTGFTLLTVGRFVKEKDYPTLLRAVAVAKKSVPDLRLWMAGDGAARPQLESLIRELSITENVRLLGMRKDVGFWLSLADVFVLSSVFEGLPVSLLEAMALGKPAIVTEIGGMPEVVNGARCGSVVPPSNPEALGAAIVEMYRRADREALGKAAREGYLRQFTLRAMADRYMELYQEAAARTA